MPDTDPKLEGGAYEVIRARLDKHAVVLRERLDALNADRRNLFGAVEAALIATERVTTEHNCVSRDMVALGKDRFIFGYNIQFGLKQTTDIADVFAVYDYNREDHTFHPVESASILTGTAGSGSFADDFTYLYKYYKNTHFVKFRVIGPHLFMAMRIGREVTDIKTFKWLLKGDGTLEYLGNRFDHEYSFPPQHEFDWKRANRDMQRSGEHPHVSIEDRVFVETVGGDLTIKIEDNTSDGSGIYAEPVDDPDQTLDDAEIDYAAIGDLILLRIRPYREKVVRHFVFNGKTNEVTRIDAIGDSCVLLPDDHGIIFASGYYLLSGEKKTFPHGLTNMRFERRIVSSNGEDTLFVFYNRESGDYVLLSYNLIQRGIETPVLCSGYSVFENGELIYFKTEDQPQKYHTLQIWQTPYLSDEATVSQQKDSDSFLAKIGNPSLVSAMADCREILALLAKDDSFGDLYIDLVNRTSDITDTYFWVAKPEAHNLAEPLKSINEAANSAIGEFDKVRRLRQVAADRRAEISKSSERLIRDAEVSPPDDILGFVKQLASLRTLRGEVIGLGEVRYMDPEFVDTLEQRVSDTTDLVSKKTVDFLLKEEALDPYRAKVAQTSTSVTKLAKVIDADALAKELDDSGRELEMLIDIVSNLKIEDATETTRIIDSVSTIYASLNATRAELKNKRKELAKAEGAGQFGAQIKLLGQAVSSYLDLCDTAEKCDEYLTKVMVQLEELEGKFAEFDEYVEQLAGKRDEIFAAFDTRKQQITEKRNKRANTLVKSAERVLSGVKNRIAGFKEINEINGYFAGDLMIDKVRNIIEELTDLEESVKADDIRTRLKTIQEDAVRALKDRKELFVDGQNVLKFGRHAFSVNTQELELTIVPREGEMGFHLGGTNFFEPIRDESFLSTSAVWDREVVSENKEVYRAEYLAYRFLDTHPEPEAPLLESIQEFMRTRYAEGYTKGVHDVDATAIVEALLPIREKLGVLGTPPKTRALALLFWSTWEDREIFSLHIASHRQMRVLFSSEGGKSSFLKTLSEALTTFHESHPDLEGTPETAAAYLYTELSQSENFHVSAEAHSILKSFRTFLVEKRLEKEFDTRLSDNSPLVSHRIALDWLIGFQSEEVATTSTVNHTPPEDFLIEAAAHLARGGYEVRNVIDVPTIVELTGMKGSHPVIEGGTWSGDYLAIIEKLRRFHQRDVPVFQQFQAEKKRLTEAKRETMRLDEFKPRVMSAFVRNKLINDVYLPILGDNLAKQLGTAGGETRTDRMGMLLLISPPGYGKTTLMEYVANRLGLTFMKINGPALGHSVTSLDPAEAPNMSAREEVNKLNLALEMGDNVMIYLDDIQHTNPEFLQKFISLCDAQRKIEGVYNGKARTYDLRGKKVAVVMAGNPYTESGGKFQIPDMLANRADTYNLGDILGENDAAFKASYVENSLTSNPILSKLSSRSQKDVYALMRVVDSGSREGIDFEANYTPAEIDEMVKVIRHLYTVRDTILRVNLQYIASAAQEDSYRVEPPFKLQGSYRNMNRIAEKILPLMTAAEVRGLIDDHYQSESQTLTTGAEANLLKFKELEGKLTEEGAARWAQIKKDFNKNKLLGAGGENDPVARVVAQLSQFNDGLESINQGISKAATDYTLPQTLSTTTLETIERLIAGLRAVPVEVDINLIAGSDRITDMEKTSKDSPPPLDIDSTTRQGD